MLKLMDYSARGDRLIHDINIKITSDRVVAHDFKSSPSVQRKAQGYTRNRGVNECGNNSVYLLHLRDGLMNYFLLYHIIKHKTETGASHVYRHIDRCTWLHVFVRPRCQWCYTRAILDSNVKCDVIHVRSTCSRTVLSKWPFKSWADLSD